MAFVRLFWLELTPMPGEQERLLMQSDLYRVHVWSALLLSYNRPLTCCCFPVISVG